MITYNDLAMICEKWRTSIPSEINETDRRIIFIALAAAKANLSLQQNPITIKKEDFLYINKDL